MRRQARSRLRKRSTSSCAYCSPGRLVLAQGAIHGGLSTGAMALTVAPIGARIKRLGVTGVGTAQHWLLRIWGQVRRARATKRCADQKEQEDAYSFPHEISAQMRSWP